MIFDITNFKGIVESLSTYLDIDGRDIVYYVENMRGDEIEVNDFLDYFNIDHRKLLEENLSITSLHLTTNNDGCENIKKHGILNLQDALSQGTQLSSYLLSFGVRVDVKEKQVFINEKIIDISKEYDGIEVHKGIRRVGLDRTIYKLYNDYQINGFFYTDNILNYGGYVNRRPEILSELAKLLKNRDIEDKWIFDKDNKPYVIKFYTPLYNFENYTFNCDENLDTDEMELVKRKWVIHKSLRYINGVVTGGSIGECFSYVKSKLRIPPANIIKVYNEDEYINEYVT
ncbi:hypothetical protein QNH32_01355 [Priestia flexa]|uniref:hypothetical protein n=1 Tax=Priestia flexa TaxID=86664 RepID=UPI0024BF6620|nr:hypothetical protein [Priestia flexa]WHX79327.1 hypothetical protein QNH32_01355 [Priestia flexa]